MWLFRYHEKSTDQKSFDTLLRAPLLLQVSANDLFQADHVQIVADVRAAFDAAGKSYTYYLYPAYGDDGHELFWEVQEPYWSDLLDFLTENL